jgi:UPF0042 nucleotide-binding protein
VTITSFAIITGLSGSGKSLAVHTLEDLGYFCVDNLPIRLIPTFIDLCGASSEEITKIGVVIDVRERNFLSDFDQVYEQLRKKELPMTLIFLEADDEVLIRRYSESRRPHPLGTLDTIKDNIAEERKLLANVRSKADVMIDTSGFNVHQFRSHLFELLVEGKRDTKLFVSVVSFGYKYGLPNDSDLVFDVRFLPNPHFNDELRNKTGADEEVYRFVTENSEYKDFFKRFVGFISFLLPRFVAEGKSYLTIGIGCTGGRHRSVVVASDVARIVKKQGFPVKLYHRDIEKQ